MLKCPVCGFRNPDANSRCFRCSGLLKRDKEVVEKAFAVSDRKSRKLNRDRLLMRPVDWLMHNRWVKSFSAIPENVPYRYPFTAGFLSTVPGAGHWYVGQWVKGILFFITAAVIFVIAVMTLRSPFSNVVLFGALFYWIVVWADSVSVATQVNGNQWSLRKKLQLIFAGMFLLGITITVTQYLGLGFLSLEKVTGSGVPPVIRHGDRLVFSKVPFWFGNPQIGDVVMFDPPRIVATQNADVYSVNIKRYYQKVSGAAGDKVSKTNGTFYRNGKVMQPNEVPFNGGVLPDFEITVPADSYFIPVTTIPRDILGGLVGAGAINYVGEPGFTFTTWPALSIIPAKDVQSKGLAIINPPPRRDWLSSVHQ